MVLEWKKCYLNVPLNETGIQDHEYDTDMSNIYTVTLDTKEYDLLSDVFHEWNQKFDIIIDIFEDETLNAASCSEAMIILDNHINQNNNEDFRKAAQKLKLALSKAIQLNMPLFLDF